MPTEQSGIAKVDEIGQAIRALAEVTSGLPRQLRQLSAALQACQSTDRTDPVQARMSSGPDSSIVAARFALSEATTAALTLDRQVADAARYVAGLVVLGDVG